jgi:hypothetical protein
MRNGTPLGWAILAILISTTAMAQTTGAQLDRLVRSSNLIFIGTVEKLGAATTTEVVADKNTAIVTVEEVYTPTAGLGDLRKRSITVQLNPKRPAQPGERAVFFANGVAYGRGVVVREVDRLKFKDKAALDKEITAALARRDDQKLVQRITRANLVVVGKVVAVHPAKQAKQSNTSEHDPNWHEAVVELRSVERGKYQGKQLTILFPASLDELWAQSPKFKDGQEGLWILQKDQKEKGPARLRLAGYTALDALDFQPPDRIETVRRLAKSAR